MCDRNFLLDLVLAQDVADGLLRRAYGDDRQPSNRLTAVTDVL